MKGDGHAQFNLGLAYSRGGFGLPKNAHCAKIFMMAAAKQGDADAIEQLKLLRACTAGAYTLVHFSAHRKRFLWNRGCIEGFFRGSCAGV